MRIIKHAMEANPKKRPQTMLEFIAELKTVGGLRRSADVWYVIYTDGKGQRKKVKGAQPLVAAMIRNRKLTAEATASRQKSGEFVPLSTIDEFAILFQNAPQATENGAIKNQRTAVRCVAVPRCRRTIGIGGWFAVRIDPGFHGTEFFRERSPGRRTPLASR